MADVVSLSWDVNPIRRPWSVELLRNVDVQRAVLDSANPEGFVSGYLGLSESGRRKFWAELIIAIAKFESNWNPHEIFHEPPPLGVDSVGLLQLSYEDQAAYHLEPLSRTQKSLEDPLVNLRCGMQIFAHCVQRDSVIASGAGKNSKGAARYWSVLREGHHFDAIQQRIRTQVGL